jgi:hypothetical protein
MCSPTPERGRGLVTVKEVEEAGWALCSAIDGRLGEGAAKELLAWYDATARAERATRAPPRAVRPVGAGVPGPMTRRLTEVFRQRVADEGTPVVA